MNKEMKKQDFLQLCDALEKDIITIEEFHILSNMKEQKDALRIVEILSLKNIANKDRILKQLLKCDRIPIIACILEDFPIYQRDLERQDFLFSLPSSYSFENLASLFAKDDIWNDKELTKLILTKKEDFEWIYQLKEFFNQKPTFLKIPENRELFLKTFALQNNRTIAPFLSCSKITSLRKEPLWLDYIVEFYNQNALNYMQIPDFSYSFQLFEKNNRMHLITEKLLQIEESESTKEEKEAQVFHFLQNCLSLRTEAIQKKIGDSYFKCLLDYAFLLEEDFSTIKYALEIFETQKISMEESIAITNLICTIKASNVRSLVIEAIRNRLLTKDDISYFISLDYTEAKAIVTKKAIEKENSKGIESGKQYFGEKFSDCFCTYIDDDKLSKEQLLNIRAFIENASSSFNGDSFIVDTSALIPESFQSVPIIEEKAKEKQFSSSTPMPLLKKVKGVFKKCK